MGRNYSIKSNPAVTDQCLIWDVENSDWRLSTIQTILDLYSPTGIQEANTQYYAPAATGFSIQVNDDNEDTHLILIPT